MNRVAFTGHRKLGEDFDPKRLKDAVCELAKGGAKRFLCGMATGFDLEAAKAVLAVKHKYGLQLVACLPCENQSKHYSDEDKALYDKVLSECDEVVLINKEYRVGCMFLRDRYMVDNCDVLLCYLRKGSGGTFYTVSYAKKMGKEIIEL